MIPRGPWPRPGSSASEIEGRFVRLERWNAERHAEGLYQAVGRSAEVWQFMPRGPFASAQEFSDMMDQMELSVAEPFVHFVVRRKADQKIVGSLSFLRLRLAHGSVEIGQVAFSPEDMQRTAASTEANYLMMRHVFDQLEPPFRRLEWKCWNLNLKSHNAAVRLGYVFEGVFRNDMVIVKNGVTRSRDTEWLSITDSEWPNVKRALELWLAPTNFDEAGQQRRTLQSFRAQ